MFIRLNKSTDLERKINTFFQTYRSNIITLTNKSWKKEDIDGEGCSIFTVSQYYFAMYIAILFYLEIQQGIPRTWTYYKDKYKITELQDKLACNNVSLSEILKIFGINIILLSNLEDGIEFIGIEESFIVEPDYDEVDPVNVNIEELLAQEDNCKLLITL